MKVTEKEIKGGVIHDFPYTLRARKCPHYALISLTQSGSCIHRCPMCYARAYPWSTNEIVVYKNLPSVLEGEIKRAYILPPFYLSQVSDCLQPVKEVRNVTYEVVRLLIKYKLSFHIVTKNGEGVFDLISNVPEIIDYPYFYLGMTVEATEEKRKVTSPGASPIEERLEALSYLSNIGIPTVGRLDPTIIGFVTIKEVIEMLDKLKQRGVKHIIGSTGYYTRVSMGRLLNAIRNSPYKKCVKDIKKAYNFSEDEDYPDKKRFRTEWKFRVRFHKYLKKNVESSGMTYAVCLELPKEYDSKGIKHCEGIERNFVHKRDKNGDFFPVPCSGDCIRSCPDRETPPCGRKELQTQYPYNIKTLYTNNLHLFRH